MTTNIQLAKEVARHVTLQSISLVRANIDSDLDLDNSPAEIGMMQGHRCEHRRDVVDGLCRLNVFAEFKFTAKEMRDGDEVADLMSLTATFSIVYTMPSDIEIEDVCYEYFAEVNGPYNCWPYWRELVQTATGRVGLAGVTVPVYRPRAVEVGDASCKAEKDGE